MSKNRSTQIYGRSLDRLPECIFTRIEELYGKAAELMENMRKEIADFVAKLRNVDVDTSEELVKKLRPLVMEFYGREAVVTELREAIHEAFVDWAFPS